MSSATPFAGGSSSAAGPNNANVAPLPVQPEMDRMIKDVVSVPIVPLDVDHVFDAVTGLPRLDRLKEHLLKEGRLTKACALRLIRAASDLFAEEPNTLDLRYPVTVCGDVHGQFFDLIRLFDVGGDPKDTQYLFLGDYVDRGCFSTEVVLYLYAHKLVYPGSFFMLRGNHECRQLTAFFNFRDECTYKYDLELYEAVMQSFDHLPLGAMVNKTFFCVHGGLSPEISSLAEIASLDRHREIPREGPMCDLLWSDPYEADGGGGAIDEGRGGAAAGGAGAGAAGGSGALTYDDGESAWFQYNDTRQCSYLYGVEAVKQFVDENRITAIIRAHEAQVDGYKMQMVNSATGIPRVITIFSAPNYCFAEGTPVALADGTARRIEAVALDRASELQSYSPDAAGCLPRSTQAPFRLNQGVKPCVELLLEDGRTVVCTADHRIRTLRGERQVGQLDLAADRVLVAAQGPLPADDVAIASSPAAPTGWSLDVAGQAGARLSLDYDSPATRAAALAFARLLGCAVAGGNTTAMTAAADSMALRVRHTLDKDAVLRDVRQVFGKVDVQSAALPSGAHAVVLPAREASLVAAAAASAASSSSDSVSDSSFSSTYASPSPLPALVACARTPLGFKQEFLAALCGACGAAPRLDAKAGAFSPVQLRLPAGIAAADLAPLLAAFGLDLDLSCGALSADQTVRFAEAVGFRHAVTEQQRLAIAAGWYKSRAARAAQRERLAALVSKWARSLPRAEAERRAAEELRASESVFAAEPAGKTLVDYLIETGARAAFGKDDAELLAADAAAVPAWHLAVVGVRPVGSRPTYDLCVRDTHLFLANGVVAHNCDVYKNKAACLKFDHNILNIKQFVDSPHPYYLPNFMDVFQWSLPFVAEKVTDMLANVLEFEGGEEEEEAVERKASVVVERSGLLKKKVMAVTKLLRMYKVLRTENEAILALKQLTPNHKVPMGLLAKGKEGIKDAISTFESARAADRQFERRPDSASPPGTPSTVGGSSPGGGGTPAGSPSPGLRGKRFSKVGSQLMIDAARATALHAQSSGDAGGDTPLLDGLGGGLSGASSGPGSGALAAAAAAVAGSASPPGGTSSSAMDDGDGTVFRPATPKVAVSSVADAPASEARR